MQIWWVIKENDNILIEIYPMKQKILPAVAAIIFNEAREVLLQRRKDTGKWCIISGHVEFGESVEQAIVREIKEETNTDSEIIRCIGVYSSPQYQTYDYGDERAQYVLTYFEARLKSYLETDFSNNETAELRFFPPDQLPADMDKINPHWLQDALDNTASVFVR